MGIMMDAKGLPTAEFVDYSLRVQLNGVLGRKGALDA